MPEKNNIKIFADLMAKYDDNISSSLTHLQMGSLLFAHFANVIEEFRKTITSNSVNVPDPLIQKILQEQFLDVGKALIEIGEFFELYRVDLYAMADSFGGMVHVMSGIEEHLSKLDKDLDDAVIEMGSDES